MGEENKEKDESKGKYKSALIGSAAFAAGYGVASNLVRSILPPKKVDEEIIKNKTQAYVCPFEDIMFESFEDFRAHYMDDHKGQELVEKPRKREVEEPIYKNFSSDFSRVNQKNTVLSRSRWDEDFRDSLQDVAGISSKPEGDWLDFINFKGKNEIEGAIYPDDKVGNLDFETKYKGYEGHLRNGGGEWGWKFPISEEKYQMDPEIASSNIKRMAELFGADLIGITEIDSTWIYSHYYDRATQNSGKLEVKGSIAPENQTNISYDYAIVMGVELDWDLIKNSPNWEATTETSASYSKMAKLSARLAKYIRGLGYPAVPSGNDTTQSIPLAIDAGLGQLGRNGLLITPDQGARISLCLVYTNIPLKEDEPIDFGMRGYCNSCNECAEACPVDAIKEGEFSVGRIDSESCLKYWIEEGVICANCIKACPWSNPNFDRGNFGYEANKDSGGEK